MGWGERRGRTGCPGGLEAVWSVEDREEGLVVHYTTPNASISTRVHALTPSNHSDNHNKQGNINERENGVE